MEDGERVPVEVGEVAPAASETVLEDGTIVINLQAQQCADESEADKIVVCAHSAAELAERYGDEEEPAKLQVKLGENGTATAVSNSAGMPMGGRTHRIGTEVRFRF
jgi:hypothetical protein